jgi:hypothetical protein
VERVSVLELIGRNHSGQESIALSRAINLALSESTILKHCRDQSIGVSAVESLPQGGVRLVCMSSEGAAAVRTTFASKLVEGDVKRERSRPSNPLW